MTGGEPLMDRNTFKVFDYVLAFPKPDLHIDVTSNFSVEDSLFDKYLGFCTFRNYLIICDNIHIYSTHLKKFNIPMCFS